MGNQLATKVTINPSAIAIRTTTKERPDLKLALRHLYCVFMPHNSVSKS